MFESLKPNDSKVETNIAVSNMVGNSTLDTSNDYLPAHLVNGIVIPSITIDSTTSSNMLTIEGAKSDLVKKPSKKFSIGVIFYPGSNPICGAFGTEISPGGFYKLAQIPPNVNGMSRNAWEFQKCINELNSFIHNIPTTINNGVFEFEKEDAIKIAKHLAFKTFSDTALIDCRDTVSVYKAEQGIQEGCEGTVDKSHEEIETDARQQVVSPEVYGPTPEYFTIKVENLKKSTWFLSHHRGSISQEIEKLQEKYGSLYKLKSEVIPGNSNDNRNLYLFSKGNAIIIANELAKVFESHIFSVVNTQGITSATFYYEKKKAEMIKPRPIFGGKYAIEYLKYILTDEINHQDFVSRKHAFKLQNKEIEDAELANMKAVLHEATQVALHAITIIEERPAKCEKCGITIPLRSAVLISPTTQYINTLRHYHLCPPCFDRVRHYIADLAEPESRIKLEDEIKKDKLPQDKFVETNPLISQYE